MPTINNVFAPNYQALGYTGGVAFDRLWKLSRSLKKAGWKYLASSNGSSKNPSVGSPTAATDLWNQTPGVVGPITNNSPLGLGTGSIAAPTRGRATITGLTGIVASDKGRFLEFTNATTSSNNNPFQIEEVISSTSVRVDARSIPISADANNGLLQWVIRDPMGETYPTGLDSVACWWLAQGPSFLRIPITATPVAGPSGYVFLRGENIVQTTTGAEGEIRGVYFDSTTNTGYLAVYPRLRGTGSGVYGWDTTNVITGSLTGSTVTQNGTAIEYRHELVIFKSTNTTHAAVSIGYFDPVADASDMFSAKVSAVGCTATNAPGYGGTGNSYPTFAWAMHGSNVTSPAHQLIGSSGSVVGNAQIIAVDCIEEQNYSADGSFILAVGDYNITGGRYGGLVFMAVDDGEDGDLQPWVTNTLVAFQNGDRGNVGTNILQQVDNWCSNTLAFGAVNNGSFGGWRGWVRRGLPSASWASSTWGEFVCAAEFVTGPINPFTWDTANPESIAYSATQKKTRIPVRLLKYGAPKMRKGTLRYIWLVSGGSANTTYDNKQYIQFGATASTGCAVTIWDGVTTPKSGA
jgi:hypothetical protein